jgi:hypothetical protein
VAPRPERPSRPRWGHRRRTLGRVAALAIALALALAAATCGDDEDPPDRTTSTTASGNSSTTPSPEEEVEAAYLAFWEMAVRLAQNPNPDDPEITQRTSGEAMGELVDGLTTLRASNRRSEFGPQYAHNVLSVEVSGDVASLEDCTVDDSRVVDAATGQPVVEGVGTELLTVTMVRRDSRWLVDRFEHVEAWEGAVECV